MGKQAEDKTMLHLNVTRALDKKIGELAVRANMSKAALGTALLEAAIEDHEFFIKALTHPIVKRAIQAIRGKSPTNIRIQTD